MPRLRGPPVRIRGCSPELRKIRGEPESAALEGCCAASESLFFACPPASFQARPAAIHGSPPCPHIRVRALGGAKRCFAAIRLALRVRVGEAGSVIGHPGRPSSPRPPPCKADKPSSSRRKPGSTWMLLRIVTSDPRRSRCQYRRVAAETQSSRLKPLLHCFVPRYGGRGHPQKNSRRNSPPGSSARMKASPTRNAFTPLLRISATSAGV
jgi:hypothetical protein